MIPAKFSHRKRLNSIVAITISLIAFIMTTHLSSCRHYNSSNPSHSKTIDCADSLYEDEKYLESFHTLRPFLSLTSPPDADTAQLIRAYDIIGNINFVYDDYLRAAMYFDRVANLLSSSRDSVYLSFIYHKLLVSYCGVHNRDKAYSYRNLLSLYAISYSFSLYHTALSVAYLRFTFGSRDKAINNFNSIITLIDSVGLPEKAKATSLTELIDLYIAQNKPDSALSKLKEFELLTAADASALMKLELLKGYMKTYSNLGQKEKALRYTKRYMEYSDSVLNKTEFMRQAGYDSIDGSNDVSSLSGIVTTVFGIAVMTMAVIMLAIVLRRALRKKAKSEIPLSDDYYTHTAAKIPREPKAPRELYDRIVDVLSEEENYSNPDFNLNRLADILDVNVTYISNAINEYSGKNFRGLLNDFRVRKACECLDDTEHYGHLTIRAVSESVGFVSQSAFIRAFRASTGMTPSKYLRRNR